MQTTSDVILGVALVLAAVGVVLTSPLLRPDVVPTVASLDELPLLPQGPAQDMSVAISGP